jgi:DNA-directed RNA polymerase specialized sigma24 family protein
MLDLPLGTVTWKYSEAIKKLRKEMEGKHNEG